MITSLGPGPRVNPVLGISTAGDNSSTSALAQLRKSTAQVNADWAKAIAALKPALNAWQVEMLKLATSMGGFYTALSNTISPEAKLKLALKSLHAQQQHFIQLPNGARMVLLKRAKFANKADYRQYLHHFGRLYVESFAFAEEGFRERLNQLQAQSAPYKLSKRYGEYAASWRSYSDFSTMAIDTLHPGHRGKILRAISPYLALHANEDGIRLWVERQLIAAVN
jgi:hypothetical protein